MTSVDGSIMSLAPGEMMISPATLCVPDHTSTALMYPALVSLSAATGAAGPIKADRDEIEYEDDCAAFGGGTVTHVLTAGVQGYKTKCAKFMPNAVERGYHWSAEDSTRSRHSTASSMP